MAYITLNEIKEILPEIMRDWIDKDDESWEWIFQEIEQKCHVGKPGKGKKKKWKKKLREDVDDLQYFRHNEYEVKVNGLKSDLKKLHECLNDSIQNTTQLGLSMKDMGAEVRRLRDDVKAAKSMAETAKNRTEVDYSKYSGKSDGKICYGKDCEKMCSTCKYSSNIDGSPRSFDIPPCDTCNYNNKWEAKENE